jgi:thiol-disulfide isomerase/thioredoxin
MKKILIVLAVLMCVLSGIARAETYYKLDGSELSYETLISAPKTILFIWTTWCPVCREDLKSFSDNPYLPEDVKIFYVNIGEKKSRVEKFVNILGLQTAVTDNILLDPESVIAEKFSIIGIPTFIFFKNKIPVYRSYFINKQLIADVFEDE